MARKVFISFLGTNNYVKCIYLFGNKRSQPVRFVQEAIISDLCQDWSEQDRIFIFCTSIDKSGEKGSKEINWLDNGQEKPADEEDKIGLEHRLMDLKAQMKLKPAIECIEIPAGHTEEEIWEIFDTVYGNLLRDDHIYFDVTHAFRSIPLFSIVLFNYAKFMIGTHLESIMYGGFEKLGPAYKVRQLPLEERLAPIVDLTDIARLQEYNQIASGLKKFGKIKELGEIVSSDEDSKIGQRLQTLGSAITELDEYISTINLNKIKEGGYIIRFRDSYPKGRYSLPNPIRNILEELDKETQDFVKGNSLKNIEAAIKWTIKHDMLMQTYPLTEEYICLFLSEKFKDKKPKKVSGRKARLFFSDLLGMPKEDFDNKNWKGALGPYPDYAEALSHEQLIQTLRPVYAIIKDNRNSLAHGNGSCSYQKLRDDIPNIEKCLSILHSESSISTQEREENILLNLSNHPSPLWEKKQIDEARKYGDIEDMPFPSIHPEVSASEIHAIAEEYADKILEKAEQAHLTVHIMGEMTFTFDLVSMLKAEGITCIASTTERIADVNDNTKISEFHFVRFREY